jgi:hypothetical protein
MEIDNNKICQSTENQQKGNDKQTKQDDNSSKTPGHDKTGTEPQSVLTAFHLLENKLDCHLQ